MITSMVNATYIDGTWPVNLQVLPITVATYKQKRKRKTDVNVHMRNYCVDGNCYCNDYLYVSHSVISIVGQMPLAQMQNKKLLMTSYIERIQYADLNSFNVQDEATLNTVLFFSFFASDKYWWQQANPSLLAATRSGLGYSSSIHIPAESSYTYPSIITPAHVDTPGTVLPHYAIDKCGYGYMTSSYGHIKQSEMLGGQDMSYKGAPRRKKTWSRAVFTSLQRRGLEKRFEVQKYVNKPDRKQLASALGLTDSQVK